MKEIDLLKEFDNKALVKFLSKQHAEDVSFHNKSIRLKFLGQKLSYRVVKKRVGVIGNWNRHRNVIYFDEKLVKKDVLPILVHESVEKFVTRKLGLHIDSESHKVAQAVERHFIHNRHLWKRHEERVWYIWFAKRKNKK